MLTAVVVITEDADITDIAAAMAGVVGTAGQATVGAGMDGAGGIGGAIHDMVGAGVSDLDGHTGAGDGATRTATATLRITRLILTTHTLMIVHRDTRARPTLIRTTILPRTTPVQRGRVIRQGPGDQPRAHPTQIMRTTMEVPDRVLRSCQSTG